MRGALRRRCAGRADRGTSLVELMVAMFVMGIVVAATATLAIGFTRTNAENVSRQDQIDTARSAVERMTLTTRTAVKPSLLVATCDSACAGIDAFMQGKDMSMQFYANLNNPDNTIGPSRVSYTVSSAGVMTETIQTPSDQKAGTPTVDPGPDGYVYCSDTSSACQKHITTRRVADGVLLSTPIFTYWGPDGQQLLTNTASGLSADDLANVLAIEITLTVQSTNATTAMPTTYIQRVTLPNSQAVIRQGKELGDQ